MATGPEWLGPIDALAETDSDKSYRYTGSVIKVLLQLSLL